MSLSADFLLPKASAVHTDQNLRSAPRDAGQSDFAGAYAQARESGDRSLVEPIDPQSGLNHQIQQAITEQQDLAAAGNPLPLDEEAALLTEPEAVSFEALMLFGHDTGFTSSTPMVSTEQAAELVVLHGGVDDQQALSVAQPAEAEPAISAPLGLAGPVNVPSTLMGAAAGQQAAFNATGIRQAGEQRSSNGRQPELNLASQVRQSELQADASLISDPEMAEDAQQEFSQLLRSAAGTVASGTGQVAIDGPDSPVNPLTQAMHQANAAQREATAAALQQPLSMRQPGMSEAVVERVMWLSSQNLRSAEIQLDPAELGRLEIRISLNQEHTQISFASPHASVREALEGQMHRLREMFAQQGMDAFDVNVSDQSLARGDRQGNDAEAAGLADGGLERDDVDAETLLASTPLDNGRGLVDFYA